MFVSQRKSTENFFLFSVQPTSDYCQDTPNIFLPIYINGDPLGGGNSGTTAAIKKMPYGTSGNVTTAGTTTVATASQVGSLWGVAYDRKRNKIYSSAVLRRHAGLGPLGLGGIYQSNATSNATASFVDVQATLNINVGSMTSGDPFYNQTNTNRGLPADAFTPNYDVTAFSQIGKVGIGDIDISEDADFLYFVNLFDKKLYKLDITGASPTLVTSYIIPSPCTTGNSRPFGLRVKDGIVYVGVVCDGSTTQSPSDMRAYVFGLSESTGIFSPIFDFPLTYTKGYPWLNLPGIGQWHAWTDDFEKINSQYSVGSTMATWPQPILSDIEIDLDGALVLGFADRSGLQMGWFNYGPIVGSTTTYVNHAGGDILRAAKKGSVYVLENNAYVGGLQGSSPGNNQGPGFGEFYNDNYFDGGNVLIHSEVAFGALALKPGSGQSIYTCMDPLNGTPNSGGYRYVSNTTGLSATDNTAGAYLYQSFGMSQTFGKAVGLGDIELACSIVSYLEIGNYVWVDTDGDGVQDPKETGIPNVQVRLYKQSGLLVGLTTTNANGEYYFNQTNVDINGVNTTTGAATAGYTGLAPNTQYFIVLGLSGTNTFNTTSNILNYGGNKYVLTNANTGEGSAPNQNDSDATLASGVNATFNGYPYIVATTGEIGSVDHTYDFGFTFGTIGNYVWTDSNGNGLQDEPTANGVNGVTVTLYQETSPGVFTLVQTTATANDANGNPGYYLFMISQSGNYQVKFPTTNNTNTLTQQTTTAATDGNSDANATTGESPIFAMNILGTGVDKDNLTIDAGYSSCHLSLSISGTDVSCNGGTDGTASVTASGNLSPVTYLWSNGGTTASISGLTAGTYSVTVTENATCTAVTSYTINEPTALSVVCTQTDVTTNGGSDGTASVNATGGTSPYTYLWNSGETASSISGKTAGTYTVTVTDDNGCTAMCNSTIQEPSCNLSAIADGTPVLCNGGSDGTASVTASGNLSPVTYLWSNGGTTANISGLTTGTYTVTVTESATCTAVTSYTVNEPTAMGVVCTQTDVTTNSGSDGTASVNATGGTSPYTYLWSSGETASSISGKTAGTYTVTVTDDNGCTAMCNSTIQEPGCNLSAIADGTPVLCNGGSDGTANVTASGNLSPVTYLWSNGGTTASISGLTAGTYTVTVTENATCTAVTSYTVNEPTALSVVCSKTDVTTNSGSDGTASVNATGGTSPYTYLWSSGETASSISGKTAGTYTVTVTDDNGCTAMCNSTIQEPGCNLSAIADGTPVLCNGGSDGTANVTASGNLSPVTYLWSNGGTTASISGLTTGTYTVTVTESATCTAVTSYTVNEPTALSVVCSKTDVTTNSGSDGTASVNATGGTSPYTYLWSSGETASSISGKTSGTYTVTVTDNNGCTAMCAQTITEPGVTLLPDLSLTKTVSNAIVALNGTVTFTLTLTNDNGVDATGVVVTDVLPAGVTFVSSSDPTNVGISGNTLTWNVGNMLGTDAPKMLDITVTANSEGSFVNNAEITDMNETDTDSTPNNDVAGEDDQDQACFSVPTSLCSDSPTASITITATTATTYQWYVSTDNGATYTPLSGETSQTLVVNNTLMGGNNVTKYFKVAYNGSPIMGTCGDVMCCPVIITTQTCVVCPVPKCITIGITKH
ncbi:MAG: DUF11 domain-containing protein [Chitinophagales bacterium]|nr:DUF11 domain-containing protein [Chitinophagales bacterium]